MEIQLPRSWKEEFAQAAAAKREDILFREKLDAFEISERRRRRTEQIKQERKDREDFRAAMQALATPEKIIVFRERLDAYDAKAVEALMENSEALDAVRKRIDRLLLQAHVLPDGRRVFKTTDGTKVFDESGQELKPDVVSPRDIADSRPRWETYKADLNTRDRLELERKELLDYQSKIDAARAKVDAGGVTNGDLDTLGGDLEASMPEAVRRKVADTTPNNRAPEVTDSSNKAQREPTGQRNILPQSLQF